MLMMSIVHVNTEVIKIIIILLCVGNDNIWNWVQVTVLCDNARSSPEVAV